MKSLEKFFHAEIVSYRKVFCQLPATGDHHSINGGSLFRIQPKNSFRYNHQQIFHESIAFPPALIAFREFLPSFISPFVMNVFHFIFQLFLGISVTEISSLPLSTTKSKLHFVWMVFQRWLRSFRLKWTPPPLGCSPFSGMALSNNRNCNNIRDNCHCDCAPMTSKPSLDEIKCDTFSIEFRTKKIVLHT